MDDLVSRRRALAGKADLTARIGNRTPTRSERRLLDHYNATLGVERRDASATSAAIMRWCASRTNPKAPLGADERRAYAALVTEHRAVSAADVPDKNTTNLNMRRRVAALWT